VVLAELLQFFRGFGPGGELAFLFAILCLDAMLVPTLPELFVLALMLEFPGNIGWGLLLLTVVVAAELTGNGILFYIFRKMRMPKMIEKTMKKWVGFLAVHDERIILVNRVAPILPFVGAFIAMMKWNPRKSFFYVLVGGSAKYSVLLAFVFIFNQVFDPDTARNATISMILAIVIVSFVQGYFARKKHLGPVAARVAHISEKSAFVPPAATAKDDEHGAHGTGGKE
jgi:membrane protein DedA with SNARE-associated domain